MASKTGIDVQVLNTSIVQTGAQAVAVRESTLFLPVGGDAEAICKMSGEYKKKRNDLKARSKFFKKESVPSITLKYSEPLVCVYHIVMEKFEEKTKLRWFENMGRTFMDMMKKADKKGIRSIACSLLGSGKDNEYESDSINAILGAIVNFRSRTLQTAFIVTSDKNLKKTIQRQHSILLETQPEPDATFLNRGASIWITNLFQRLFAAKNRNQDGGLFRKRSMSFDDLSKRADRPKRNSSRRLKKKKESDDDIRSYHSDDDTGIGYQSIDETTVKRPVDTLSGNSGFPKTPVADIPIKDEPDKTEQTVNLQDQTSRKQKSETRFAQPDQRKEVKRYSAHIPSIKPFKDSLQQKNRNQDGGLFRKRSMSVDDLSKRADRPKRNSSRRLKKKKESDDDIRSYHSDDDTGIGYQSIDETTVKRPFDTLSGNSGFPKTPVADIPIKDEPNKTEQTVNLQDQTSRKQKSETRFAQPDQRKVVKKYSAHMPSIKPLISRFETITNSSHGGTKCHENIVPGSISEDEQTIKMSVEESRFSQNSNGTRDTGEQDLIYVRKTVKKQQTNDSTKNKASNVNFHPENKMKTKTSEEDAHQNNKDSVASSDIFGSGNDHLQQNDTTGGVPIASEKRSKLNTLLDFSQLPTSTETRCLKTKRDDVVEPLLNVYRDEEIVNGGIKVVFEDEIENDADLTVELFTTFWNEVMQRYWKGEDATVPSMSLGRSRKEQWKYESMGRILSHTAALTSNLPCRISRSALCCILLEKEPEEKTLLSDLILYVTLAERKVLEKALMDLNSLENSESEQLVDFFSHYEMGELPKRTEIREQILEIAKQILVMAPERFYKLIRKGIPEEHQTFWKQLTVQQISQYVEDKRPTAPKVIAKMKTIPGHLKLSEESVFYFLHQFVNSLDQDGILQFLLYVTGSIHLPVMPIHVSFNNLVEEHRLPKAHTCNNTLKLSPSYNNVQEFRREFMQVLNSSYSFQYTLKE